MIAILDDLESNREGTGDPKAIRDNIQKLESAFSKAGLDWGTESGPVRELLKEVKRKANQADSSAAENLNPSPG